MKKEEVEREREREKERERREIKESVEGIEKKKGMFNSKEKGVE